MCEVKNNQQKTCRFSFKCKVELLINFTIGLFTLWTQNIGRFHFRIVAVCTLG